jgi:hypothetical protein
MRIRISLKNLFGIVTALCIAVAAHRAVVYRYQNNWVLEQSVARQLEARGCQCVAEQQQLISVLLSPYPDAQQYSTRIVHLTVPPCLSPASVRELISLMRALPYLRSLGMEKFSDELCTTGHNVDLTLLQAQFPNVDISVQID